MPQRPSRRFVIVDDATICEARDHQVELESRPRKRQRVDDEEDEEQDAVGSDDPSLSAYVRDPEYYADGGESATDKVVVRIERTLFRVPRTLFRNSRQLMAACGYPTFSKKFDDSNPLELDFMFRRHSTVGIDLTEAFRSLLWGLNVLQDPVLLEATPRDYPEVERILQVAELARDLEIEQFHTWSIEIAHRASSDPVFMDSCSSAVLRKLIQVASSANNLPLLSTVAHTWGTRILQKKAPPVPAIQIAETYELSDLRGIAYYVHLQDMADFQPLAEDGVVTQLRADPKLNNAQVLRLLSGYYSLVSFWERFRLSPFQLPCSEECSSVPERHGKCNTVWAKRWTSAVGWKRIMGYNSADVLGLLGCLKEQLNGDEEVKTGVTPSCRIAGLEQLEQKRESIKKNLASHFLGCI